MDLKARQDLNQGFGRAFELAFEMVVTPLIFGFGGWLLDRWLGTAPLFVIVLSVFAVVGMGFRMYYDYAAKMAQHEEGAPWTRS